MHFLERLRIEIMKPGLWWDDCGNISLPIGENDDTLKVLITSNRYFLNPHTFTTYMLYYILNVTFIESVGALFISIII